jgi:hypothetical protein
VNSQIRKALILGLISLPVIISACGGKEAVDSSTWLLVVAGDTVTVGEVGNAWNKLEARRRELFLEKENVIGEFIVTYARKVLLEEELHQLGYLSDRHLLDQGDSWLLERSGEHMRRLIYSDNITSVPQDQVDYIMSFIGRSAYFTIDPDEDGQVSYGPVPMTSLPADMLILMDTLSSGSAGVTGSGISLRLDSITAADPQTLDELGRDSINVRNNVTSAVANRNFESEFAELRSGLTSGADVDSAAVEALAAGYLGVSDMPDSGTVLLSSAVGTWTAGDVRRELEYYMSRYSSLSPENPDQLYMLLDLMQYNRYSMDVIADDHPEEMDSLRAERDRYVLDTASEVFYADSIESMVNVTEDDMQRLFNNLEEPLTIPEKRILQAVHVPQDSTFDYGLLTPDSLREMMEGRPGFIRLAADSSEPQITRPLGLTEIPGFHGNEVFRMDPSDTVSWLGPLPLRDGSGEVCFFRLVQVLPERNAEFDEVRDQLRSMTRARLEEQRTVSVMRGLEQKYGMTVNEDVLDQLPDDPGVWSDL